MLPSEGTILVTNDLLLDNEERFHLYDTTGGQSYSFTPETPDEALFVSLAPSGRRMAVLNVRLNQFSLAIMDFNQRILVDEIPVNNVLYFDEAQWSSDGRYFMYFDTHERGISIFMLDIVSEERLEIPIGEMRYPSAAWTKDRRRLAFTHSNADNSISQIWLADGDGENQSALTRNENDSYCPTWSPDGENIAYLEQVSTGERLRYINVNSSEEPEYYSGIWLMTSCPLWSSDGKSILFIGLDGNTRQTTVIQLDIRSGQLREIFGVNQTASLQLWR